ncbi:nucleotidyltransferase family protein [Citreimonas salinaria]|uniref:MurNAc alpha-1-phosphate uridylyltransferase n=1 Tax=Citreimonas salinaria TaxID=321339 RepID=A0A1H3FA73_9RHOB|nr:nucleotidyltransferase family protein [Citreimonas salinaria]SDX87861.1 MurNAc alpha-1-phosphate uridylyltransferase [Citreimonas salinaria]
MPDAVMLFAAGFGTRMGALIRDRPKPLVEVAGRALLDHALDQCARIPRRVVNAHYHAEQIEAHVAGLGIPVSIEKPEILDTGGGLRRALPLLGPGPVFTLNTDAVWRGPNPLHRLAAAWDPGTMDALLLCVPLFRAHGRQGGGDFTLDHGRLSRGGDMVYTGAQIVNPALLEGIEGDAFSISALWDKAQATDRMRGIPYCGHWCDVGHPGGIKVAEEMLRDV